jgi:hypothetical protein
LRLDTIGSIRRGQREWMKPMTFPIDLAQAETVDEDAVCARSRGVRLLTRR